MPASTLQRNWVFRVEWRTCWASSGNRREEFGEAVVGLGGAGLHSGTEIPVAIADRIEEHMRRQRRLAVGFNECQHFQKDVTRHQLKFKGVDKSIGRHDLAKFAAECELVAFRRFLDESPGAAGTNVQLV